jgi:type IV secretory pathway VirB4 component
MATEQKQNTQNVEEQIKSASLKQEIDATLDEKETATNLKEAKKQQEKVSLIDRILGPLQKKYSQTHKTETISKAKPSKKTKQVTEQPEAEIDLSTFPPKLSDKQKKEIEEAEKIFNEGLMTLKDLIAPSAMKVKYKGLEISGLHTRSFFVFSYPRYINTNWLSPVINFDATMDISMYIYPTDSAQIMKVLKTKVAQMQSSIRIQREKGVVRDPAIETALEDAESLRTAIQRGQEKFFQFGLYFTIYSDDEDKLEKLTKQLESILGGRLVLTRRADLRAEQAFNSCLPMALDEIEVFRNMNTSPLSSTFPFTSASLTDNEGILYGLNRHNDSLVIFDRFNLENANSVVFAKSGAGKSYAVKLEILRYLMLGTDVIVIDPENEYEQLAQTVGGTYLKVSLNSDRRINPFDLPSPLKDETLKPGDLLRSNIITLHGLLKLMLGKMTPTEEGIIDKALNDVYALKGITMDLVDPSDKEVPTMVDLQSVLEGMDGAESLVKRVEKYTRGTFSGIFNMPTNIDLNSGLVVFSVRDLEDELRPVAMYIILNYIWNKVRSELKRRIMVIDEAWSLMQHEDSAKFLFGLVKRARKYYLGITTITQDVEDFLKSDLGKPVITNSSMQLLLKQSPTAAEKLQQIFNLTEGEKYLLLNSGVGQGLYFAGNKHVALQIIASYTEDQIVTTNPEELLNQDAQSQ